MCECILHVVFRICLIGCLQDADCSGRTLATLLVAWVATLMVTSILCKWEHMWIVLTILTILFLLICACMAYNIKKTHMRNWLNENQRTANDREARNRRATIWTVSGGTDNRREAESHRIVDLPPSYSSVVLNVQPTSDSPRPALTADNSTGDFKFEDPPPYLSVISVLNTCDRNTEATNEPNTIPSVPATKSSAISVDVTRTDTHTTDD